METKTRICIANINCTEAIFSSDGSYTPLPEVSSMIPACRMEKVTSLRHQADKQRSLAASLLLSYAMKEYGFPYDTSIQISSHGKPYIASANGDDFHFNLSHSGSYAAIAYGPSPVGIDIQENRTISEGVANRIQSEREKEDMSSYSGSEKKQHQLLQYWCIKESYIKFIGTGLSYDMRKCEIDFDAGTITDQSGAYPAAHFAYFDVDDSHGMAVCSEFAASLSTYSLITSFT